MLIPQLNVDTTPIWMIPVDTSVEWPQTGIWGWAKGFFVLLLIHFYLSHLSLYNNNNNNNNNNVSNCL
jgi:hypothetical protein